MDVGEGADSKLPALRAVCIGGVAACHRHTFMDSVQAFTSGPKMLLVCSDAAVSQARRHVQALHHCCDMWSLHHTLNASPAAPMARRLQFEMQCNTGGTTNKHETHSMSASDTCVCFSHVRTSRLLRASSRETTSSRGPLGGCSARSRPSRLSSSCVGVKGNGQLPALSTTCLWQVQTAVLGGCRQETATAMRNKHADGAVTLLRHCYVKVSTAQAAASGAVEHGAYLAKFSCTGARDVQPGWDEAVLLDQVILLKFRLQLL